MMISLLFNTQVSISAILRLIPKTALLIILSLFCFFTNSIYAENFFLKQIIIETKNPIELEAASTATFQSLSKKNTNPVLNKYKITHIDTLLKNSPVNFNQFQQNNSEKIKDLNNYYLIYFEDNIDIEKTIQELGESENIINAQPNFKYKLLEEPNDHYYSYQWNMPQINMQKAWEVTKGAASINIAIIDSGIDWQHEDLKNNIWQNKNEIINGLDDDGNGYADDIYGWDLFADLEGDYLIMDNNPMDNKGHGTHIAGIAAAETNNSIGVAGIAPNCKLMAIKAYNKTFGSSTYLIMKGVEYAKNTNAHVINISMGQDYYRSPSRDIALENMINSALYKNIPVIVAAGNDDVTINYNLTPASCTGAIVVAAVLNSNDKASYSNYGNYIDFAAPGGSSGSGGIFSTYKSNNYLRINGTSMSAPHVAGAAALIKSAFPDISTKNLRQALANTATDLGSTGWDKYYGYGLIDPYKALLSLDTNTPTASHAIPATANSGSYVTVTLNVIDDLKSELWPSVNCYYRYKYLDSQLSTWNTTKFIKDSDLFYKEIETPTNCQEIQYHFDINDAVESHNQTLPKTNPETTYFSFPVRDLTGPNITFYINDNDYFSKYENLKVTITDNISIDINSLEFSIISNQTQTFAYNTSSIFSFTDPDLNIDLSEINLDDGVKFKVSIKDTSDNLSQKEVMLKISNQLKLFGPEGENSPILNSPNPFDPQTETTKLCFQISTDAEIDIYIYSLNLQLVKKYNKSLYAGYHEIEWDGIDNGNDIVPNGVYILIIKASANGQTVIKRNKIAVLRN
jgi:subtilisin family serine protease